MANEHMFNDTKGKEYVETNQQKQVELLVGEKSIENQIFSEYFHKEILFLKSLTDGGADPFTLVFDIESTWVRELAMALQIEPKDIKEFVSMLGYLCSSNDHGENSLLIPETTKNRIKTIKTDIIKRLNMVDVVQLVNISTLMSSHFAKLFDRTGDYDSYSYIVSLDDLKIPMDRKLTTTEKRVLSKRFHDHIKRWGISVDMMSSPATGITRSLHLEEKGVSKNVNTTMIMKALLGDPPGSNSDRGINERVCSNHLIFVYDRGYKSMFTPPSVDVKLDCIDCMTTVASFF